MPATDNKHAKNTITQKLMGRAGTISTLLYADQMETGQKAGLCLLGQNIHEIGLMKTDSGIFVYADNNGKLTKGPTIKQNHIFLRVMVNLDQNHAVLLYSMDGRAFLELGEVCALSNYNYWKAVRPGLFSYNSKQGSGKALFDWFHYEHDGPQAGH